MCNDPVHMNVQMCKQKLQNVHRCAKLQKVLLHILNLDIEKSQRNELRIKNVELTDGDCKTELDAVVITPAAITIIEVKNTTKNVFIDDQGNYYHTGEFLKWDCNIAEKMNLKTELLRKALAGTEFESMHIESVVVFTNNRIEVQNRYQSVRTCFVSQLSYIIDGFRSDGSLSDEKMNAVMTAIEEAAGHESYPFEFDVQQYKEDFAVLMATLEMAGLRKAQEIEEPVIEETKAEEKKHVTPSLETVMKEIFSSRHARSVGGAAAALAISVFYTATAASIIKKGAF